MRRAAVLVAVLAFLPASTASAVGPWLGVADGAPGIASTTESVSFVATVQGAGTTVAARDESGAVVSRATVPGKWGIPLVTFRGDAGGLSENGRVLVLAQPYGGNGGLRPSTSFAVMRTKPLALRTTVRLRGDFGFDALSADGRTLYLIQHVSEKNLFSYRVRAYDLRAGKLLAGVIADKRQASWLMNGMPVARATSPDGRWVYTLYSGSDNYPFVHALDTATRTAVCIGLPWDWSTQADSIQGAGLSLAGGTLKVVGGGLQPDRFALDTRTFAVTAL
jgi:hypothetical protein